MTRNGYGKSAGRLAISLCLIVSDHAILSLIAFTINPGYALIEVVLNHV
jgi:hypothetical protein